MKKFLLAEKIGMTQIMDVEGNAIPVTVIKAGPCPILKKQTVEKNGYNSILLGFKDKKESKLNKPEKGFFNKLHKPACLHLTEFRVDNIEDYADQENVTVDIFQVNEKISVRGKTIGRGFTGAVKRHNFSIGPMSHGSKSHRIVGSIGGGTTPGRVLKGKKMPGHYGNVYRTIKNLEIIRIDKAQNLLIIKGAIPGKSNNILELFVSKK